MSYKLAFQTLTKHIEKQLEKHDKSLDKVLSKSHRRSTSDVIAEINIKVAKEKGAIQAYKKIINFIGENI